MPTQEDARAQPMSKTHFRLMSLGFRLRDLIKPRTTVLREVHTQPGFRVLDYGCGTGSYITPLAELVGESGKIYALDIHPLAIREVQMLASRKRLDNVQTILSDCATGLPPNSVDLALLYDVFHDLHDANGVLAELHRVLRAEGTLSFTDHHMKETEIVSRVTSGGLFKLASRGRRTYSFLRQQ